MNRARRAAVFVAVVAGLGAAALLGWPVGPVALVGVLLCAIGPWVAPSLVLAPWPVLTLAVLAAIGAWVAGGAPPRAALGVALIYLQVHRVLGRTGPADDRVSLLLSGLMLVAAASASEDLAWLAVFLVWLGAAPIALVPAGFSVGARRQAGVLAGLAISGLVLTLVVFPLLPRFRVDTSDAETALTGFSGQVELGALDVLLDDPEEVFAVEASPALPDSPVYFRGTAMDHFDGRTWAPGTGGDRVISQAPAAYPASAAILRFTGTAPEGVLFTAGRVRDVRADGQVIRRDAHGAYRLDPPPDGPVSWQVVADGPWGPGNRLAGEAPRPDAYLQLPEKLDPRVAELALAIRGDETDPRRVADRVADYLRTNSEYTRTPRDAGAEEPLTTFLFDRRTGHCEYFASAQAVLLRTLGIQARVVNGFVSGEPRGSGRVVRRYHAHAWAEVWTARTGWILVDATPGPGAPGARGQLAKVAERIQAWWESEVLGFDRSAQRDVLWSAGSVVEGAIRSSASADRSQLPWTGLAVIWGCGLVIAILLDRILRRVGARLAGAVLDVPQGPVARAWGVARQAMAAKGYRAPPSLPPLSAARWLGERVVGAAEPLEELAWLLYRVKHGGESEPALAPRAKALAAKIRELA